MPKPTQKHTKPTIEQLLTACSHSKSGMSVHSLCKLFDAQTGRKRALVETLLRKLVRDFRLIERRQTYRLPSAKKGYIHITQKGYGFVECADATTIFIPARYTAEAADGDLVVVSSVASERGFTGCVITIEKRALHTLVGTVYKRKRVLYLQPTIQRTQMVRIARCPPHVRVGDTVRARVLHCNNTSITVCVEEVLVIENNQGVLNRIIIEQQIPNTWPQEVATELDVYQAEITLNSKAQPTTQPRRDMTQLPFVTIDGASAKDYDDAVYVQQATSGWKAWVAIADVSYFVTPDSALDKAACNRGTSVYFDTQTIPMLPPRLSEDLCSLLPHVPRYVFVCEMDINTQGELQHYQFYSATIVSQARLTYRQVDAYLNKTDSLLQLNETVRNSLTHAFALTDACLVQKQQRGALHIDLASQTPIIKRDRIVALLTQQGRSRATELIEELMILANRAAALSLRDTPNIVRVHAQPTQHKCQAAAQLLRTIGMNITQPETSEDFFKQVMTHARGHAKSAYIGRLLLRLLPPAFYSTHNIAHFGLMLPDYTHFTSPIRRYSDLVVHRLLKAQCGEVQRGERQQYSETQLADIALQCSYSQKRAERATLAYRNHLLLEYAQKALGTITDAMVLVIDEEKISVWLTEFALEAHIASSTQAMQNFCVDLANQKLMKRGSSIALGDIIAVRVDAIASATDATESAAHSRLSVSIISGEENNGTSNN